MRDYLKLECERCFYENKKSLLKLDYFRLFAMI